MLSKISWPAAVLLSVVAVVIGGAFVGVPVWLVARGSAPPALLVAPLTTILGTLAGSFAAYMKGRYELPPYLTDPVIQKAVRSVPPPPSDIPVTIDDERRGS